MPYYSGGEVLPLQPVFDSALIAPMDSFSTSGTFVSRNVGEVLWQHVFDYVRQAIEQCGGSIKFGDLGPYYRSLYAEADPRRFAYTALSDGQSIILHKKIDRSDSPPRWAWDALHLFSHMLQWHMSESQARSAGLKFWGPAAQSMAVRDFLGASDEDLVAMQTYEIEAHSLSLAHFGQCILHLPLGGCDVYSQAILTDFRHCAVRDIAFLTRYYGTWGYRDLSNEIFSEERLSLQLRPLNLPCRRNIRFSRIEQICVPVVHEFSPAVAGLNSSLREA